MLRTDDPSGQGPPGAYPDGAAFIDGSIVAIDDARLPLLDTGFTRSDCTYDVVHVWDGAFFRLSQHLARFRRSMTELRLDPGVTDDEIAAILTAVVRATGLRSAYVAMIATRGRLPKGSRDIRLCRNRFCAYVIPFVWIASPEKQAAGFTAHLASYRRIPSASLDPTIKNFHWLDMIRSLHEAYDAGADTAFLLDIDGHLAEGPGFNIFIVKDGAVFTPVAGGLGGITRQTTIDLCDRLSVPCHCVSVTPAMLFAADEVFCTATAGGIMPVTRVNDTIFSNGAPGPVSSRLRDAYWSLHADGAETTPVDYR